MQRWAADELGVQCTDCSLWTPAAPGAAEAVGRPMPPPPPSSVGGGGGGGGGGSGKHRVSGCGRCAAQARFWRLKDALDELQALDLLQCFGDAVDEEVRVRATARVRARVTLTPTPTLTLTLTLALTLT